MPFDRPVGEEERGRDLAIRLSLHDEGRDAFLGRGERARRRRAPTDSATLTAGTLRPECGADLLEHRESLLQRCTGLPSPFHSTLGGAEREQRATPIEGDLGPVMPCERLPVDDECSFELSIPRREERPATSAIGERRSALEPTSVALVPVEDLDCLVTASELDQGLDQIDGEASHAGLGDGLPANDSERRLELRNSFFRRAEDESEVAEGLRGDDASVVVAGRSEHAAGGISRLVGTTQLGVNKGLEREVVPGEEGLSRLVGRLLPGSGTIERGFEISEKALGVAE